MRLFDLRKTLKTEFETLEIDPMDADYIISEVISQPITNLPLIENVDDTAVEQILKFAKMRKEHIPVNKIFKHAYFYGLDFKINNLVLAPRQDSELLVETALKYIRTNNFNTGLDLCTGSGCLAISIKKNCDINMTATDLSKHALNIAKANAKKHNVDIDFVLSDMFENIDGKYDIIISNPPYIDSDEIQDLDIEVKKYDPHLALDGGSLGLDYYKIIHDNLRKHLNDGGIVVLEIGEGQRLLVEGLFNDFELLEVAKDYNDIERVLVFKK